MRLPAQVRAPHGLADVADLLAPGALVNVDGRPGRILGRIIATDHAETWLECLLDTPGDASGGPSGGAAGGQRWLAVEAPSGPVRCTLWQRTPGDGTPEPGLTETDHGLATYTATGRFGAFPVPPAGTLDYVEFVHATGRVAAARFTPDGPWLIGRGSGRPVTVAVTPAPAPSGPSTTGPSTTGPSTSAASSSAPTTSAASPSVSSTSAPSQENR